MTRMGTSLLTNYASIIYSQQNQVLVHSSIPIPLPPVPKIGFDQNLRYLSNHTLWLSLDFNGNGSWILDGMINCSLIIIHDGLYMKEISPSISSAATMIYCTKTRARCTCTWAERSDSAGAYCGEILGRIMTQLILRAAAASYQGSIPWVGADCNNNRVVIHGNNPNTLLSTKQTQAVLLWVFKNLVATQKQSRQVHVHAVTRRQLEEVERLQSKGAHQYQSQFTCKEGTESST